VPRGLEALILAQSDVPTTGALNLMMKWERLWRKERVMRLLCVVPVSCRIVWFLLLLFVFDLDLIESIVCCVVAFSTGLQYSVY
jgi:hypothetical protein